MDNYSDKKIINLEHRKKLDFQTDEAFKSLRTNIEFCGADVRVIAITSCMPNEGKSAISLNLAISMAESGKNVLYIDADMRKSVMQVRYKLSEIGSGLSHFLAGKRNPIDVVYQTSIYGLNILPTGPVPPNPAELLGTRRFANMVNNMRDIYDIIIIDTPPLGSVIDAAVVAKSCDGIAVVLAAKEIGWKFAERIIDQVKKTGTPLLGVILNKVDISGKKYGKYYGRYYGKYYGKYYGSYYGEEK